ncbi:MAG TPA: hypothetical protein VGS16_05545 [Candidatus Dormibacteraeota bacterium]|nr:hypothetical protein [Candidatus Dormibacteraeota bacterium]
MAVQDRVLSGLSSSDRKMLMRHLKAIEQMSAGSRPDSQLG